MLQLKVVLEDWDEVTERFVDTVLTLELEHSLATLSKWEEIWEKPYLSDKPRTTEEARSYIQIMNRSGPIADSLLERLPRWATDQIEDYLAKKMTATWFANKKEKPSREIITAEVLYYWMFTLGIPLECEHWHLNKLLTLIRVFEVKNSPPKKRSAAEIAAERYEENERRLRESGSSG